MKRIILNISVMLLLFSINTAAQRDTIYSLSLDAGLGYSRYLTTLSFPDLQKQGFSGSLKIMWHPEHLLSLGFETGYHYLYYIKSAGIEASLISVPLLFVTSMKVFPLTIPHLRIQGGGGAYFLLNSGSLSGASISSSLYSFGYHLGAQYLQPLSSDLRIGAEFKYYYISKLQDSDIALRVLFSYDFLDW